MLELKKYCLFKNSNNSLVFNRNIKKYVYNVDKIISEASTSIASLATARLDKFLFFLGKQ